MKDLKKILNSAKEKNSAFRKKIEKEEKNIKIKFNSDWFYGWGGYSR